MVASSKPAPSGETPRATENVDRADASYRVTAQGSLYNGSEGLYDRDSRPAAAAAMPTTGGADTHAVAAVKKPLPRRRTTVVKGVDICDTAEGSSPPAETSAKCVLRPIFIRSLARLNEINDGVITQVVVPPPAARKPATGKTPRRVVVQQSTARTAGAAVLMTEALLSAAAPLLDSSPRSTTTSEKFSEALEVSASNNIDQGRGWLRCRWAGRLLEGYSDALETRPLTFKCITSALVGGAGDVAAQAMSWTIRGGGAVWHDARAVRQTLAVAIDGFCINAPFLHFAYDALDRWLPTEESTANAVAQVLFDAFVINPVYALTFILTTGLFEGKSLHDEIVPTIQQDYATLVLWLVVIGLALAPPHIFLFKRFPLKWRVLIADVIDLLWTFVACFIIEPR